jgi:nitroreductase
MGGFDEPAMREAFGAPTDVRILAMVAVGYPGDPSSLAEDLQAREAGPQRRIPLENVVAYDRWNDSVARSARDLRGPRDGS